MALSPDQWLARLASRMDDRAPRLARLRSYMDGDAPLPEGAEGCRDAYKKFQRKARTNFGELVTEAVGERMQQSGFRVGDSNEDDDQARQVWRRNRLQIGSHDVHRDMLGLSVGYAMVQHGDGGSVVTRERPEQVITEQDPLLSYRVRAGLKVYRDEVDGFDVALLHVPGVKHTYFRELRDEFGNPRHPFPLRVSDGWTHAGSEDTDLDVVPIVPFLNRGGLGEFETHTDVLDRINWVILQRLVITAMQAYRQRAVKGNLPETDADGNEVDYSEVFRPGPGSLWELPDGVELWESAPSDLSPILESAKADLTHLAAVTRTPMSTLMPEGQNQSAEGAAFAREGLVFKSQDRVARAGAAWATVMGIALALERGQSSPVDDVETLWLPVERQSLIERAQAASQAQDVPWRTRMTDIWQFPADRVDRMEAERAQDALTAGLAQPASTRPAEDVDEA